MDNVFRSIYARPESVPWRLVQLSVERDNVTERSECGSLSCQRTDEICLVVTVDSNVSPDISEALSHDHLQSADSLKLSLPVIGDPACPLV